MSGDLDRFLGDLGVGLLIAMAAIVVVLVAVAISRAVAG